MIKETMMLLIGVCCTMVVVARTLQHRLLNEPGQRENHGPEILILLGKSVVVNQK